MVKFSVLSKDVVVVVVRNTSVLGLPLPPALHVAPFQLLPLLPSLLLLLKHTLTGPAAAFVVLGNNVAPVAPVTLVAPVTHVAHVAPAPLPLAAPLHSTCGAKKQRLAPHNQFVGPVSGSGEGAGARATHTGDTTKLTDCGHLTVHKCQTECGHLTVYKCQTDFEH